MITIKKLLYYIVILMTISFGQDMDLPVYSSDQSKATVAWKVQNIIIAEIGELSVTPPKISIFIKSDSKLGFKRFTENFNLENLYRYTYQPLSNKEGLFTLFFRRFPVYELFVSDNEIKFIYDKKLKTISNDFSEIKSILPDTTISVNYNGVGMNEVLKALSFKYGLNIVNSSTSDAPITINAKNVALKTIFNSIVETNNLSWYSTDNVIVVTNLETLGNTKSGLETEVIHLNYIESTVAVESFKDQLSSRGKIKSLDLTAGKGSGGTNKVIITDTQQRINYIKKLIQLIDTKPKQVNIAVKFIETSLQSDERLGIDWTQRAQLSGPSFAPDSGDLAVGIGSWQEFSMAKMDLPLYQVVIEALESDNKTKLLQEPQVTTFDNYSAEVNVGTTLPVLVPQGEGSVFGTNPYTFQDIDVNIVLNVTPRINSPNEITMQLDTQVSAIINYVGPDKDRPVVSNRSAKTNVVVGNGETLLIGGLILEDDSDITGRVPFFGNIPIIKNFFSIDTKSEQQRELLIFITPSIIG
tara:strand:+ start:1010 stop:2587 length:1578 start_codon:yes stop_codon:yes gene_type:complete